MSNPIVVEAIESEFNPVLVHNNRKGKDAQLLKRFNEPSWNNPVIRFLNKNGSDVIDRKDGVWTTSGTAERMVAALKAAGRQVPFYLESMVAPSKKTKSATFAMHCYWEGEAKIGSIDGVIATRSGWLSGLEVVTVVYQPSVVDYSTLVTTAKSFECASRVFAHDEEQMKIAKKLVGALAVPFPSNEKTRDAKASDQKYYLASTPLIVLPLTECQATKLNAAVKSKEDVDALLSPRQKELAAKLIEQKRRDPKAFAGWSYPVNPDKLAEYQQKLVEALAN